MLELSNNELKAISIFEKITGVVPSDVYISPNSVVFFVPFSLMGKAIGKKGSKITKVRQAFARQVLIFEETDNLEQFIRNIFNPVNIKNINIHEKMNNKIVYVTIDPNDRGIAIGKNGNRIKLHQALLKRKFNCELRLYTK
ncbi:MAG: NusA-like transcription termination signal-binding factor [Candidatus Anstonellaceae archaeon]